MQGQLDGADVLDSRQFAVAIRKLADSLSFGTDRSPFLGSGQEYVQSRPYQFGDPIKAIDWRVTARTRKFHVKEYEATKRLPVYLLVDTSASMTISSAGRSKYATAVFLAGGLALACLDRISPVGLLGVGDRNLHIRPSLSKDLVLQWLHQLRTYRHDERTTLGDRVIELTPSLAQRVLVIVLSDLHDPRAMLALKRMGQQHDCVVLQLRDPLERGFRRAGFVRAREAETGRSFVTRGRTALADPGDELRRAGIDHLMIDTDRPFASRVRLYFKSRALLGRGAR